MYEILGKKFNKLSDAAAHAWINSARHESQRKILSFVHTNLSKTRGESAVKLAKALKNIAMNPDNSPRALKVADSHLSTKGIGKKALKEVASAVCYAASHLNNGELNGRGVMKAVEKHYATASKQTKEDLAWALLQVARVEKHAKPANKLAEKLKIRMEGQ